MTRLLAAALLLAPVGAAAYGPAVNYALECQGCHRADGAETPNGVPGLANSVARYLALPGGREYLVTVPGVAQAPLDDAALAAVLNWVLERFDRAHVPPDFVPYTAAEVGRLRVKPLIDVGAARRRLLAGGAGF